MARRLVALAAGVPAALLVAGLLPPAALLATVLIPAASIAWALRAGPGSWAIAMAPGGLAVGFVSPEGLPSYGASVLAGPLVAWILRAGRSPRAALAWGVAPVAAWTIALALSGFQPFPEDVGEALEGLWRDTGGLGGVPADRLPELRASSEAALEVLRQTWVASEAVWFWVALVVAWWFLGRLGVRGGHPPWGPLARFDVPDLWVGVLIAGLALVLAGESAGAGRTAGWNLVFGSGFVFAVRGLAIETHWMDRAGWRKPPRIVIFSIAFLLAMPLLAAVTCGLGLFDAWFDFRRIRGTTGDGRFPFGSSEDVDRKE